MTTKLRLESGVYLIDEEVEEYIEGILKVNQQQAEQIQDLNDHIDLITAEDDQIKAIIADLERRLEQRRGQLERRDAKLRLAESEITELKIEYEKQVKRLKEFNEQLKDAVIKTSFLDGETFIADLEKEFEAAPPQKDESDE